MGHLLTGRHSAQKSFCHREHAQSQRMTGGSEALRTHVSANERAGAARRGRAGARVTARETGGAFLQNYTEADRWDQAGPRVEKANMKGVCAKRICATVFLPPFLTKLTVPLNRGDQGRPGLDPMISRWSWRVGATAVLAG